MKTCWFLGLWLLIISIDQGVKEVSYGFRNGFDGNFGLCHNYYSIPHISWWTIIQPFLSGCLVWFALKDSKLAGAFFGAVTSNICELTTEGKIINSLYVRVGGDVITFNVANIVIILIFSHYIILLCYNILYRTGFNQWLQCCWEYNVKSVTRVFGLMRATLMTSCRMIFGL